MKELDDELFGKMTYDNAWEKSETITMFGKERNFKIVLQCFEDEEITEAQRDAYKTYLENYNKYEKDIPNKMLEFYLQNYEEFKENFKVTEECDKDHVNEDTIKRMIKPKYLYINQEGDFGIIFDTIWGNDWDTAVILSEDEIRVTADDELI